MFDRMLVITAGVNEEERAALAEAFGPSDPPLVVQPLGEGDMSSTVEAVVRGALEDRELPKTSADTPWPLAFLAVFPRSRIDDFISAFKGAVARRGVFASLTPTNGEWTWSYLIEHLAEEHEMMMEMEKNKGGTR